MRRKLSSLKKFLRACVSGVFFEERKKVCAWLCSHVCVFFTSKERECIHVRVVVCLRESGWKSKSEGMRWSELRVVENICKMSQFPDTNFN